MRRRRAIVVFVIGVASLVLFGSALPSLMQDFASKTAHEDASQGVAGNNDTEPSRDFSPDSQNSATSTGEKALDTLAELAVKGRAPKTGYERSQFGDGWATVKGCTTRNIILYRDLENPVLNEKCQVETGTLHDAYSGSTIQFSKNDSSNVQIDHVVALSAA